MFDMLRLLMENWPSVGLVATLLIGVFLIARYLYSSEMRDMRRRIDYLDEQVLAMRYRDRCYFEFVLLDENYHNRVEVIAAQSGYLLEPHISFLEFRDRWMRDRGLADEQDDIWRL